MICIFYELFKIESKAWAQIPAFSHPIGQRTESKVCQFLDTWGETNSFLLLIIFLFNFHQPANQHRHFFPISECTEAENRSIVFAGSHRIGSSKVTFGRKSAGSKALLVSTLQGCFHPFLSARKMMEENVLFLLSHNYVLLIVSHGRICLWTKQHLNRVMQLTIFKPRCVSLWVPEKRLLMTKCQHSHSN